MKEKSIILHRMTRSEIICKAGKGIIETIFIIDINSCKLYSYEKFIFSGKRLYFMSKNPHVGCSEEKCVSDVSLFSKSFKGPQLSFDNAFLDRFLVQSEVSWKKA